MRLALVAALLMTLAAAQELHLSKDGVGPITVWTHVTPMGKKAHVVAWARNESGRPIRFARFSLRAQSNESCAFELWTMREWASGDMQMWDLKLPLCRGMPVYWVRIEQLDQESLLYPVRTLFIDKIEGDRGVIAHDRLVALLARTGRFQLVRKADGADAVVNGRAEKDTDGIVLFVVSTEGDVLWAWDDSRPCMQSRLVCAVDEMVHASAQ